MSKISNQPIQSGSPGMWRSADCLYFQWKYRQSTDLHIPGDLCEDFHAGAKWIKHHHNGRTPTLTVIHHVRDRLPKTNFMAYCIEQATIDFFYGRAHIFLWQIRIGQNCHCKLLICVPKSEYCLPNNDASFSWSTSFSIHEGHLSYLSTVGQCLWNINSSSDQPQMWHRCPESSPVN